jgi:hypothetical protein
MNYIISRLPNEKIIVADIYPDFNFNRDVPPMCVEIDKLIQPGEVGVYIIYDMLKRNLNFGDLVVGLAEHQGGRPGSLTDPRLKAVTVANGELVKMGNAAMGTDRYGNVEISLFEQFDEALAAVRSRVKG